MLYNIYNYLYNYFNYNITLNKKILLIYLFNIYNYLHNFIRYYKSIKNIYLIRLNDKIINVKQIYIVEYDNIRKKFIYLGKYIYVSNEQNEKYDIKDLTFDIDNIESIELKLQNIHNLEYKLVFNNDITSKVGQILYLTILLKTIKYSNIYLLLYYYLQYYLKNNDIIKELKIKMYYNNDIININVYDNFKFIDLENNKLYNNLLR